MGGALDAVEEPVEEAADETVEPRLERAADPRRRDRMRLRRRAAPRRLLGRRRDLLCLSGAAGERSSPTCTATSTRWW